MTEQRINAQGIGDGLEVLVVGIAKWLLLVAAVALGVCLGLYLFFRLVGTEMQHDMQGWTPTMTTTPAYAP